jgi:Tol biopolymer transport system component
LAYFFLRPTKEGHMGMRKIVLLVASAALAVLLACGVTLIGAEGPARAAFPGDNGKIAFGRYVYVGGSNPTCIDIFAVNPDGTREEPLANTARCEGSPSWSPDGTKIAYDGGGQIYIMNADGNGQTAVAPSSPINASGATAPDWSPDGTKIVFQANVVVPAPPNSEIPNYEIFVINADGTNPTRLTNNPGSDFEPTWSPDGTKIAFTSKRHSDNGGTVKTNNEDIYIMDADGTDPVRLTHNDGSESCLPSENFNCHFDGQPDWSPDGSKIAFISGRTGVPNVFTMDSDGENETNVTEDNSSNHQYPAWAPDGTKIAYWSYQTGTPNNIWIIDAQGATPPTEVPNSAGAETLDWQPNTPPAVTPLRPAPGSSTQDRTPRIKALTTDLQTNLVKGDLTLSLDGKTISRRAFAYDTATDRLSYTTAKYLSYGKHTVQVVAKDSANVATTKTWSFSVIRW